MSYTRYPISRRKPEESDTVKILKRIGGWLLFIVLVALYVFVIYIAYQYRG